MYLFVQQINPSVQYTGHASPVKIVLLTSFLIFCVLFNSLVAKKTRLKTLFCPTESLGRKVIWLSHKLSIEPDIMITIDYLRREKN